MSPPVDVSLQSRQAHELQSKSAMSLKETIEFWKSGIVKAEEGKYAEAIEAFLTMPEPGSRIYFNIASMYLRLGDLAAAEDVSSKIFFSVHYHLQGKRHAY